VNDELERILKVAVMLIEVLSWNLSRGAEENTKILRQDSCVWANIQNRTSPI
jgi:cell division protein FtsB